MNNSNSVSRSTLFWVFGFALVLGLLLGFFVFSLSSQLKENEHIYLYSFSDVNGHFFDLQEVFCADAVDGGLFCFSYFSLNGSELSFGLSEELEEEVLGDENERNEIN